MVTYLYKYNTDTISIDTNNKGEGAFGLLGAYMCIESSDGIDSAGSFS